MSKPLPERCEFDPEGLALQIDVKLNADVKKITPVVNEIMKMAGQAGCAKGKEFEVETALREALANAVRHGCGHDATLEVRCQVVCDLERGMLIVVSDPGEGFDPATVCSPLQGENLYREHGRGIYLINRLMDEVRYERGGTEIHMLKK
jgi:serine/threonine-protein kinase RsbW